jgi:hypothetical protein
VKSREEFKTWWNDGKQFKEGVPALDQIYDYRCGECVCGEASIADCPVHCELQNNIPDEEIERAALKRFGCELSNDPAYKNHWCHKEYSKLAFAMQYRDMWKDGYQAAMSRNARLDLEKIFPSEEEFYNYLHEFDSDLDRDYVFEQVYHWFREKLFGKERGE